MRLSLLVLLCIPLWASGQNQNLQVLAVQGGFSQSPDMSLSWTLGENFTETINADDLILTQGFQQSFYKLKEINLTDTESFNIKVYPNPTRDILNLDVLDEKYPYAVEIIDATGQLLYKAVRSQAHSQLDLSGYASGEYFIRISNPDILKYSLFNVIKL